MGELKFFELSREQTIARITQCKVLRENDELVCHSCGHRWDVGESDRECPRASVSPAQRILRELENEC